MEHTGAVSGTRIVSPTGTFGESLTVSGLPVRIDIYTARVDSLNTVTGSITITGSENFPIRTEGQIITISGAEFIENMDNAYDGSFVDVRQAHSVTSNGTTITYQLSNPDGLTSVPIQISGSNIYHTLPDTVSLTAAGTDINPQENWVYLLESGGSLTLTSNTSGFPAAPHGRVARVIVQTAPGVQTNGPLKLHAYTDHLVETISRGSVGHVHAIGERIRSQFSEWQSGTALTYTVDTGTTPDDITIQVTAGVIFQLHTHDTPTWDTSGSDIICVLNDFTA